MPSIPKEVYFIYNAKPNSFSTFDKNGNESIKRAKNITIVDASKKKKIESLFQHAGRGRYDYNTRQYVKQKAYKKKISNDPQHGYKVLNLSTRYNGSSRSNILTPDGFSFELHEDIMIQIMTGPGISSGGELNGEYVWASTRKGASIIPVDSPTYREMLNATKSGKIKAGDLKVGTIYVNGHERHKIFLGRINTKRVKHWYYARNKKLKEIKNGFLWLYIYKNKDKTWKETNINELLNKHMTYYNLSITKTPSVYRKAFGYDGAPDIKVIRNMFADSNCIKNGLSLMEKDRGRYAEILNMSDSKSHYTFPGYESYFKELIVSNIVDS